jgi:two-component system LytT family sensor kinase
MDATREPLTLPAGRSLLWLSYACGVAAIGLLQGTSELQHYLAGGGRHPWEPYLWELSSAGVVGALAPLVYRWHVAGLGRGLLWRHALGAAAFVLVHVGATFAIRFGVYALAGVRYQPGSPMTVLAYETGKDLVSYALITAICHGIHLFLQSQRRHHEMQRLRSELAEARLARLGEQLQPHFLFNSLNLISSVMYEDVARADRLLCDLAALLRQTLAAQQTQQHSLGDELALIEPYLTLMQARFGSRLQVAIDASDSARRCRVPTLLLISPVENAIKHDVAHSNEPVQVRIHAWCDAAGLQLLVDNSGTAPLRTERKGAIGLENLRQRLHALHGDRAQVTLQAREGGGSRLRITVPDAAEVVR